MRLIVVNDRSFVDPVVDASGALVRDRSGQVRGELDPGGLATALTEPGLPALFVSSVRTPAQGALAVRGGVPVDTGGAVLRVRLVPTEPAAYRLFYDVAANRLLWLLHHGCWPRPDLDRRDLDAFRDGYRVVNENLARAVAEEVGDAGGPVHVVWQDYQLYLAPALTRAALPAGVLDRTVLQHFVHVPFPGPGPWRALPPVLVRQLLSGLLGNDLVGFQLPRHAREFVLCCQHFLGLDADLDAGVVRLPDGRAVRVASYPVPASSRHLAATVQSGATREHRAALRRDGRGRRLVFRTERVDPVKAFPEALRAFAGVLRRPGITGTVRYVAQLVPARMTIPEWTQLRWECERFAAEINALEPGEPVQLTFGRSFERVVAGYLDYDVLDVVPRADGMNLVALEGPLINQRDGVLVLSRTAGAYQVLAPHALGVEPTSVEEHSDALHHALTMPPGERAERARGLRELASAGDPTMWLRSQLADASRWRRAGASPQ